MSEHSVLVASFFFKLRANIQNNDDSNSIQFGESSLDVEFSFDCDDHRKYVGSQRMEI